MKVLMVTNMYPTTKRPSFGSFIKTQIDSLVTKGVEVDVIFINGNESRFNYVRSIFTLYKKIYTKKYDLIHAHYGLCGLIARLQFRYPIVVSYCGDDLYGSATPEEVPSRGTLFLAWFNKQLSKLVDRVIVKSHAMGALLPIDEFEVIPNGVDFERFRPMDKQECRRKLGIKADALYVLYPYQKTCIRKGFKIIEAAVNQFNQKNDSNMEILVAYGIPNEEMPIYMNAVDVMVLASLWEGSPNAVKEAMACNTRVISTPVGDVPELIDGIEGCMLCEREPEDIVDKLKIVMGTPEKTKGRELICNLRIAKIADQVIAQYHKVLEK